MKKSQSVNFILILSLIVCVAAVVVCSLPRVRFSPDETVHGLMVGILPRLTAGIFLIAAIVAVGDARLLKPTLAVLPRSLLWSIPCFLVAAANFPFSALIGGAASLDRSDLIWLFAVRCLSIGLMEEAFFRGLVLPVLLEKLDVRHKTFLAVLLSSAVFGLVHLLNLVVGAGVGATFLQAGYSFLLGCMLAVALLKTRNLWLCVFLHALFDFGGSIVTTLGHGEFQDTIFWILTAAAGVVCAAHVIVWLIKTDGGSDREEGEKED